MDLTVVYKNVADETLVERDSTVTKWRRYDFYIGKFGPFVERVPLDASTDNAITLKVDALKRHLEAIHR